MRRIISGGRLCPLLSLAGRDATGGVNRQVFDLRHYPSLAKVGLRDETESVLSYGAHLAPNPNVVFRRKFF